MSIEEKPYHILHERKLDEKDISQDPIEQFNHWYKEAIAANIDLPNAMTLATSTTDGKPSARIVLLKEVANDEFIFFTNYSSRKGHELAANPYAALVFSWNELDRQVRVEGQIERVSEKESDEYFASRPRESQLGAVTSAQSQVIASRDELEKQYHDLEKQYDGKPIPRPKHWGGYRLIPTIIEFWQGRPFRLHDRIVYEWSKSGWTIRRLAP